MRVLHAIAEFGSGGAERVVFMLVCHRSAADEDVGVVSAPGFLDHDLPPSVARFHVADRGRSLHGTARTCYAYSGVLRKYAPDLVHAHGVKVLAMMLVARRLANVRKRPPILATHHATLASEDRMAAKILGRADRVVCVSESMRPRMIAAGMAGDRLTVIHNAVAAATPAELRLDREVEEKLGIAARPVVSFVGRFEEQKRPRLFVDVAATVAARDRRIAFLMVGDGSLRAATERYARERGVDDVITFTGTRTDSRRLIGRSQILVSTSLWEGLSIAALEALSAGVPVVSTETDGMLEILADGAGVVVRDPSPAAIADEITELLANEATRAAMGRRGQEIAGRRFSPQAMCTAYTSEYRRVLSGSDPAHM